MSLHAKLRQVDTRRSGRAITAWSCNDQPALAQVLAEVADDPDEASANGFVFALLTYCDWLTRNTGPVVGPPPGHNGQELT